ncbi:MAG TPA: winged helix-turn-helix domain-containing protein [Pyrinomonadaceae bacterium]|jgi:DNA-binding winged helix-turn-helix (wHTH) protein/tetratricopeptide (TPR) repeat protein|nr:winged helix-turn-helix domain-containing protein [Pyrinomonadaceae bacterium]
MNEQQDSVYRFGDFALDVGKRLLTRGAGEVVPLTPKAFEILVLLVQNSGRVVDKDELKKRVWADTHVGETTLAQNIFTLRKALGDDQNKPHYIKTVLRRGYRFVAEVKTPERTPPAEPEKPPAAAGARAEQPGSRQTASADLAVLPFSHAESDKDLEYLSGALTEGVINKLSPSLRVVARSVVSRHKGHDVNAQEVGRALGVQYVLAGRLVRFAGRLSISGELIDVDKGWQVWGEQYGREENAPLASMEEVARQISEAVLTRLAAGPQAGSPRYSENAEANQCYLKGRYFWARQTEDGCLKAIEYFKKAIKRDSNYALAYCGLADVYISLDIQSLLPPWEIMPKAKVSVLRAKELDDSLAEAHATLGCVKMLYDHEWEVAEDEFRRAIRLNPAYPHSHNWYSLYLLAVGRFEESYAEIRRALECDPLDLSINQNLGFYYLYTRQYDRAIGHLRKTLEIAPDHCLLRFLLGRAYESRGDAEAAVSEFKKAEGMTHSMFLPGLLGHAYAQLGDEGEARRLLEELKKVSEHRYVPPYGMGLIHLGLGEKNEALAYFQKACDIGNEWMIFSKVNPALDGLRSDPSFAEMLKCMNLNE